MSTVEELHEVMVAHVAYCQARVVGLRTEASETPNPDIARELRRSAVVWEVAAYDLAERMKTLDLPSSISIT